MICHDYPLSIGVDSKLMFQLHKIIKIHDLKQIHGEIARIPLNKKISKYVREENNEKISLQCSTSKVQL
jgi:hypothetical protein